jgi:6-phosphogluconolactonase
MKTMKAESNGVHFFPTMLTLMAAVLLSSCGYVYKCGVTFGGSTCTPSGGGIGSSGGGNGTAAAFAYNIVNSGSINGISLTTGSSAALQNITNFAAPTVPPSDFSSEIVIAQKKFVYAAFPGTQVLYAWSIDSKTGNLTALSGSPFSIPSLGGVVLNSAGVNMTALRVNPSGTLLFIADAGNAEIIVYQIGSTGALTAAPGSPVGTVGTIQPWNLYFDGLGKYLYVSSGPEGLGQKVAAYSIQSTGALTAVPGSPFAFNMWALQGDPTGKYLIAISARSSLLNGLTDDPSLYVFNIQQSGANAGALTPVTGSPFATLYAPVNLAVQPNATNGSFVYSFSLNQAGYNPIEGYQLNSSTGALSALSASPFSNITTSPWGQFDQSGAHLFVYTNVSGNAQLGALNVASSTGDLTQSLSNLPLASGGYFAVTDSQ